MTNSEIFGANEIFVNNRKNLHKNASDSRTEESLNRRYEASTPEWTKKTADSSRKFINCRFFDPKRLMT